MISNAATPPTGRLFTVPNILSAFRLCLVPVFLVLVLSGDDIMALIVLAVSSATDFLDGVIARRFDQISRLGQLLDPAADRLFILATIVGLAARDVLPWWLLAAVVLRDLTLVVLGVLLARHGFGPLPVHHLGKVATFCLFIALPLVVAGQAFREIAAITDPLGWALLLWGVFLYWWAGAIYLSETARVIRMLAPKHPDSDTLEDH